MAHIGKTGIDLNVGVLFSLGFSLFYRIRLFSLRHQRLFLISYTECGFRIFCIARLGWIKG